MQVLRGFLFAVVFGVLGIAAPVFAAGIDCGANGALCAITLQIGSGPGAVTGNGTFSINPETGALSLAQDIALLGPNPGEWLYVTDVNGNADPILGFATSASTGAAGGAFSVTFTLPIALSGTINANSSVSYSLTAANTVGAQIAPLFGNVVLAREVDTSIGGLPPLDKGVDVGNTFSFLGGPQTQNSPVFTDSNSFVGNLAYDLMSVTVAFSLSSNSNVGISGFVQQVEVPEPATAILLVVGLVTVAWRVRRA